MLLLLTSSLCGTADAIVYCCSQRGQECFRFNSDLYNYYNFMWTTDGFIIEDPTGRMISSKGITSVVIYKAFLPRADYGAFEEFVGKEEQWLKCTINYIFRALATWAMQSKLLKLFIPQEFALEKTRQMLVAKNYFSVPQFYIHWGSALPEGDKVIVKTLHQEKFSDGQFAYAKIVSPKKLDPIYPWFCQDVASGNCDATVLYINGNIHCYKFATERGELTDWRVTQGTEANKWIPWVAGKEFEEKVDLYMKDMGLKFGRLDFIVGGEYPQFLEVNALGQFGWLDDENLTLHNEVVDAILDPSSTIAL